MLRVIRKVIGPTIVAGGVSMMDTRFWFGYLMVILGFGVLLWEICTEPDLVKRPYWLQVGLIVLCWAGFAMATISWIKPDAPVKEVCYSTRNGEYAPGTTIEGIPWDSHLAELRVALTNVTDDDYENFDVNILPDAWTHRAVLTRLASACTLTPLGGNSIGASANSKGGATKVTAIQVGAGAEFHDNAGDVFTSLATDGGYRLICKPLPSHFTIEMVFALATISDRLITLSRPPKKGDWGFEFSEIAGAKSEFDVLGPRPNPSKVKIEGRYKRSKQPFSLNSVCPVIDGN